MQDVGTTGVVGRTQPRACPSWPQGWSGEEVTCTRRCCYAQETAPESLGRAGGHRSPASPQNTRQCSDTSSGEATGSRAGGSHAGHSSTPATPLVLRPPQWHRGPGRAARAPSPLQKALPGPGLFDTLLHGGKQGKQGCRARLAPSISCLRTGQPAGLGTLQPYPPLLPMDRGHGLTAHSDGQRARTHGTQRWTEGMESRHTAGQAARPWALPAHGENISCPQQGRAPSPHGAATAEAPGLGWEESSTETNLFQAVSACLGPIYRILFFFFPKQSYTKPYMD